jgi:hypothetical protein
MTEIENLLRSGLRGASSPHPLKPWPEIERLAGLRRRRRRIHRAAILAAATLVAIAALLVGGIENGGTGPSPFQRASAAVVAWPPNEILHVRIRMVSNFDQPDAVQDTWQLTSAPYTQHTIASFPAGGQPSDTSDWASDATGFAQGYDWRTNEVVQTSDAPLEWRPTGLDQSTRDEMQALIAREDATSLGTSIRDGHTVVGFEIDGDSRIYLDATTYLPVLTQSFGMGVGSQKLGYDQYYTWDILADTPANRALLDLSNQHADATTATVTGPAWVAIESTLGGQLKQPIIPGA